MKEIIRFQEIVLPDRDVRRVSVKKDSDGYFFVHEEQWAGNLLGCCPDWEQKNGWRTCMFSCYKTREKAEEAYFTRIADLKTRGW